MATDRMITGSVAIFYLHNCQTRKITIKKLETQYFFQEKKDIRFLIDIFGKKPKSAKKAKKRVDREVGEVVI